LSGFTKKNKNNKDHVHGPTNTHVIFATDSLQDKQYFSCHGNTFHVMAIIQFFPH